MITFPILIDPKNPKVKISTEIKDFVIMRSIISADFFCELCAFVIIGSSVSLGSVLDISDSMIFLMSVANLVGVYFLAGVVKKEINEYMKNLSNGNIKKTDVN